MLFTALILYTACVFGSMAMMSISAALVLLALLWNVRAKPKLEYRGLFFWTVFLSIACAWSLVWAHFSGLEFYKVSPKISWVTDLAKLWHLFFTFILYAALQKLSEQKLKKIIQVWLGFGLCSALFGIVQHYFPIYKPQQIPNPGLKELYHATGLAGFHLSYVGILGFPLFVWFVFTPRMISKVIPKTNKMKSWLIYGLGLLVFVLAHFFSYSKTNWVGVPLVVTVLGFCFFDTKKRWLVATAVVLGCLIAAQFSFIQDRFAEEQLVYGTLRDRLYVWGANFEMIKTFPLFGVGWHHNSELSKAFYDNSPIRNFQFVSHAHNNILDQWSSTGTLGLVAFLGYCFIAMRLCYRVAKSGHDRFFSIFGWGTLFGWVLLHFNGMTQTNFWDAKILHQISFITATNMALLKYQSKKQS